MNSLKHSHCKEVEHIKSTLQNFKCPSCSSENQKSLEKPKEENPGTDQGVTFKPIGIIRTNFAEKRAVPRQANIAETILSRVELCKDLYTNPEQSLETLEEFSHLWIIYNFHLNEPHSKPKISPPRLDGKKVGVFATRSPHRPNAIGMSLVKLDRVEGSTIYFYGTDIVDSTPLIDIKPYIPSYDSPQQKTQESAISTPTTPVNSRSREDPEGEEEHDEVPVQPSHLTVASSDPSVKVPNWVSSKNQLKVIFSENASMQIQELGINQKSIQEVLENDPRSVYVREKYLSQIYNFQLSGNNVICKFDDKQGTVNVLQIRKLLNLNE